MIEFAVKPPTIPIPFHKLLKIVDESGEDYLYPESFFAPIELPDSLQEALRLAG